MNFTHTMPARDCTSADLMLACVRPSTGSVLDDAFRHRNRGSKRKNEGFWRAFFQPISGLRRSDARERTHTMRARYCTSADLMLARVRPSTGSLLDGAFRHRNRGSKRQTGGIRRTFFQPISGLRRSDPRKPPQKTAAFGSIGRLRRVASRGEPS